jgi:hypothetical protein
MTGILLDIRKIKFITVQFYTYRKYSIENIGQDTSSYPVRARQVPKNLLSNLKPVKRNAVFPYFSFWYSIFTFIYY